MYGADMGTVGPSEPIVITKIERRKSKEVTAEVKQASQRSTPKDTAASTAKSSRKQSKDTSMAADLEKAYLITAANECLGGEEAAQTVERVVVPSNESAKHHHAPKSTKFCPNDPNIDEEKPLKIEDNQTHHQSTLTSVSSGAMATTPRKPAFNPLHVILKDKNKYHTTEYI